MTPELEAAIRPFARALARLDYFGGIPDHCPLYADHGALYGLMDEDPGDRMALCGQVTVAQLRTLMLAFQGEGGRL